VIVSGGGGWRKGATWWAGRATEDTEVPGAAMSGLIRLRLRSGPREDVLAMLPTREIALLSEMLAITAAPAPSAPFNTLAVARVTNREGLQRPAGVTRHCPPLEEAEGDPPCPQPRVCPT